jgi:hypothetical protein
VGYWVVVLPLSDFRPCGEYQSQFQNFQFSVLLTKSQCRVLMCMDHTLIGALTKLIFLFMKVHSPGTWEVEEEGS